MSSRLHVGTPKIPAKPPRGKPPCTEPAVYGTNILKDPGFELHLANTGGGPLGDEVPAEYWRPTGGVYTRDRQNLNWSDGTVVDASLTGWRAERTGGTSGVDYRQGWTISTANPRTGSYHLRSAAMDDTARWDVGYLQPHGVTACHGGNDPFYAARINPGDFWKFSLWVSCTTVPANAYLYYLSSNYHKADGTLTGTGVDFPTSPNFNTTYTQYAIEGFAPPDAYLLEILFGTFHDGSTSTTVYVDIDDCVLQVSK